MAANLCCSSDIFCLDLHEVIAPACFYILESKDQRRQWRKISHGGKQKKMGRKDLGRGARTKGRKWCMIVLSCLPLGPVAIFDSCVLFLKMSLFFFSFNTISLSFKLI